MAARGLVTHCQIIHQPCKPLCDCSLSFLYLLQFADFAVMFFLRTECLQQKLKIRGGNGYTVFIYMSTLMHITKKKKRLKFMKILNYSISNVPTYQNPIIHFKLNNLASFDIACLVVLIYYFKLFFNRQKLTLTLRFNIETFNYFNFFALGHKY